MKTATKYLLLVFLFPTTTTHAQTFDELLASGKKTIKEERAKIAGEKPDFVPAIKALEKAVKLQPGNAEAHYFLGSAYDYDNASDATNILVTNKNKEMKAVKEFEAVIRLSPKYTGEVIALDPYSKLTSIWGCLGFSYVVNDKPDSARWAFSEGKKRGSFDNFALAYYRHLMGNCAPGAIIFTLGDFPTMHMWYLQEAEHFRPDIAIVNTSMLQLPWFTAYLYKVHPGLFSSQAVVDDTLTYKGWPAGIELQIPVKNTGRTFLWTLKPTINERYVLRSDMMMLDIIGYNKFEKDIYFEKSYPPNMCLWLNDHLKDYVVCDKLVTEMRPQTDDEFIACVKKFPQSILKDINVNCDVEVGLAQYLRYEYLIAVRQLLLKKDEAGAKTLYHELAEAIPIYKIPVDDDQTKSFLNTYDADLK